MKISGKQLKKNITGNTFMSEHFIDEKSSYEYGSINDNLSYEKKMAYIKENRLSGSRSVVIGDTLHLWKPVDSESLKQYEEPVIEMQAKKNGKRGRRVSITVSTDMFKSGTKYTLDDVMKMLKCSRPTAIKKVRGLESDRKVIVMKSKPIVFKVA